ncbi:MAG: DUF4838 domain-containing protein [Eubacteriales bacterium]|nr:DUF4838 domain-containing protein [Eubacteriales bacterium]
MLLAEHGHTDYRIVMAYGAHETIKYACTELSQFLERITGASVPICTDQQPSYERSILVGESRALRGLNPPLCLDELGEEGFRLTTVGSRLVLAGKTPRGTLYAVYAFLERLGCRWFATNEERIPFVPKLEIEELDLIDRPAFESREAYWREAFDGDFAVRNRLNSNMADISVRQGGRMKFHRFHHTFYELVPPMQYFHSHPEYFALSGGERRSAGAQLCLTNPEVLRLTVERVRQWIRDNPDCRVFSIAQNDCGGYCECEQCSELARKEGSQSGPIIAFVNQVAQAIASEFPDKLLHTFAYQYSRTAPRTLRPHNQVIVRLCSIECDFSHPLEKGASPSFLRDLREWSRICERLYVWDYTTNFANYLMPFVHLHTMRENLRLYQSMSVKGVLEQGAFSQGGGAHLAELMAYIQAKLLWNPEQNVESLVEEFCRGFYGLAASPYVLSYIWLMEEAMTAYPLDIYQRPDAPWVTEPLLERADNILSEGTLAAKGTRFEERIEKLRLGITQLMLSRMPKDTPGRGMLVRRFGWQLRRYGISELHERRFLEESLEHLEDPKQEMNGRADYQM